VVSEQYLLPNEDVHLTCQIRTGSLIMTNRRIVFVSSKKSRIEQTIPYDCVVGVKPKTDDRFEMSGKVLDQFGKDTGKTKSIEIRAPKGEVNQFQSSMKQVSDIFEDVKDSGTSTLDLSYLAAMPETLTKDAVLDLNTVLRDMPVHDNLVHEAVKFLGDDPFLIEESLRNGNDVENGALFAAGRQGYYWIQGKKQGRFISNVIVDTVEWENFRCFSHQWQRGTATITAIYSLTKDGALVTKEYLWCPMVNEDTRKYPWFLQEFNGPWIMSDIRQRCIA